MKLAKQQTHYFITIAVPSISCEANTAAAVETSNCVRT